MFCKKEDCFNKPIPHGKYCDSHRVGKLCQESGCKSITQKKN